MSLGPGGVLKLAGQITVETLETLVDIMTSPWSAYQYCDAVGVPPFTAPGEWSSIVQQIRTKADAAKSPEQWAEVTSLAAKIITGIEGAIRGAGPSPSPTESVIIKIVLPVLLEVTGKHSAVLHTILAGIFFADQRLQDSYPQGLFAERYYRILGDLAIAAGWGVRVGPDQQDVAVEWPPIVTDALAVATVITSLFLDKSGVKEHLIRFWYGFDHPPMPGFDQARKLAQKSFTLLIDPDDRRIAAEDFDKPLKPQPAAERPGVLALTLVPVVDETAGKHKLYVQVQGQIQSEKDLGSGFNLKFTNKATFGLLASRDSLTPTGDLAFELSIEKQFPPVPKTPNGDSVTFSADEMSIGARASADELSAWLRVDKGVLAINDPGWLKDFIPQLRFTFDIEAEASVLTGVRFKGGAGGDVLIPVNQNVPLFIGAATIESIHVLIYAGKDGDEFTFRVQGSANLKLALLGILRITVDGLGAQYNAGTARKGDGNIAGIARHGWDPVFPEGAGIEISTYGLSGGGAFFYDAAKDRLSGAVKLSLFNTFTLTGIGIYQRAHDGAPRSWILVASLVLPQPGATFTIEGVGFLYGSNRTTDPQAFLAGVETGALDAVLFPQDPIGKATQYIAALEALFPTSANANVIGVSLRISAFASKLKINLGVLFDYQRSSLARIYLLAQAIAVVGAKGDDDPSKAPVHIFADGVAIWDRTSGEFNMRIALRNSRVWAGEITGGASMFHGKPEADKNAHGTYITIGGFHPDYVPPGTKIFVPPRLSLVLSKSDHLKLEVKAYLAYTPSSVQFGITGSLKAEFYGFGIKAYASLDALFGFDGNFELKVEFSVELLVGSQSLAGVLFSGTLVAFTPTVLSGRVEVKFLFWTLKLHGSLTLHDDRAPDTQVDITGTIAAAISKPENWDNGGVPGLHITDAQRAGVWMSPTEPLRLRQPAAPLGIPIERFGAARLSTPQTITIDRVNDNTTPLPTTPINGEFAMGMFLNLSREEMLASRGFESRQAGVEIVRKFETGPVINTTDDYEEILIDPQKKPEPPPKFTFPVFTVFTIATVVQPKRLTIQRDHWQQADTAVTR